MRLRFGARDERDAAATAARKAMLRDALGLSEDVALSINEIACPDPACPTLETIILIMEPGRRTRAVKIHGGLDGLSAEQVKAAIVS